MTTDKSRILIVDDSPEDIRFLMEQLKADYAVLAATSVDKVLEITQGSNKPDVVLMDVEMPEMLGYDLCQLIKKHPASGDTEVIFVSSHDTTEQKLAAFMAGGRDYLVKPVQPRELMHKIRLTLQDRAARAAAQCETQLAMNAAMTAMMSLGEQGVVIDFMRRSFFVSNYEDLAKLLLESTASYDLQGGVQLRTNVGAINIGSCGPMPPLEAELLWRLKDAGRLQEHGNRLIANYGPVSLLVKNMPEDEDKRGRFRDHLAVLSEGAEARLRALELNDQGLRLVADFHQSLQDIGLLQQQQKQAALRVMDDVQNNLENAFFSLGLSEEQENLLRGVVSAGVAQSLENFESGVAIDDKMNAILRQLETVFRPPAS